MDKEKFIKDSVELFMQKAKPPSTALKPIDYGRLKGKSDINPQWRVEALTEMFGFYGSGWYYKIVDTHYEDVVATGEKMVYMTVELYTKDLDTGEWRMPVVGIGGDFVIVKDKNGYHGNDESLAMCLTDALGKAAKVLGVAGDVYKGLYDSKYGWRDNNARQESVSKQQVQSNKETLWKIVDGDNVEVKLKSGEWLNIKGMTLPWLQALQEDSRFTPIRAYVDAEIKHKNETLGG